MKQNDDNDFLDAALIVAPENFLTQNNYSYSSDELQFFIDQFESAARPAQIHKEVLNLFKKTLFFCLGTDNSPIFMEMRKHKTPEERNQFFLDMTNALQVAIGQSKGDQFVEKEKAILVNAINYAKGCIQKSMGALPARDPLCPIWHNSALRKLISRR